MAKLIIEENPEVLLKDLAEGFVKGNHTMADFLDMMDELGKAFRAESR